MSASAPRPSLIPQSLGKYDESFITDPVEIAAILSRQLEDAPGEEEVEASPEPSEVHDAGTPTAQQHGPPPYVPEQLNFKDLDFESSEQVLVDAIWTYVVAMHAYKKRRSDFKAKAHFVGAKNHVNTIARDYRTWDARARGAASMGFALLLAMVERKESTLSEPSFERLSTPADTSPQSSPPRSSESSTTPTLPSDLPLPDLSESLPSPPSTSKIPLHPLEHEDDQPSTSAPNPRKPPLEEGRQRMLVDILWTYNTARRTYQRKLDPLSKLHFLQANLNIRTLIEDSNDWDGQLRFAARQGFGMLFVLGM